MSLMNKSRELPPNQQQQKIMSQAPYNNHMNNIQTSQLCAMIKNLTPAIFTVFAPNPHKQQSGWHKQKRHSFAH